MLNNYYYRGVIDGWKIVDGYCKGKNRVDAKRRVRKLKSRKGIRHISVLESR